MSNESQQSSKIITILIIVMVVGVFFVWTSSENNARNNQIKDDYIASVDSTIDEMDDVITGRYNAGKGAYDSIAGECAWQAKNLSSNIGVYCHENAKLPWAWQLGPYSNVKDYLVGAKYDNISYSNKILENGTDSENLKQGIATLTDYGNSRYNAITSYLDEMTQAMSSQCEWVTNNISNNVGDYCYDTISEAESLNLSKNPFNVDDFYSPEI